MKRSFIIWFCIIFLTSCKYFQGDNCNNTKPITGKYENIYDKKAKNILIINKDGTFEQIFTKGNITKKNKGTWQFFEENCNIYLNNLKSFNSLSDWKTNLFSENGIYRLNNIMFLEDLRKEFDFYRIDN